MIYGKSMDNGNGINPNWRKLFPQPEKNDSLQLPALKAANGIREELETGRAAKNEEHHDPLTRVKKQEILRRI